MQLSARNQFRGTVTEVVAGHVNAVVTLSLPGGQEMVAVVTKQAVDRLGVAVGKEAIAVVKASNVLLATDTE